MQRQRFSVVLEESPKRKQRAAMLARALSQGQWGAALEYCARVYGGVPRSSYDYVPGEEVYSETLLAYLIAERVALRERGILKNVSLAFVGTAGSGKTTYVLCSFYGALRLLGYSRREAWSIVADNVFFDIKEFIVRLRDIIEEGSWAPCLVIDDIGASLTKYWLWIKKERKYVKLFTVLDQVKDWCGVLAVTARAYSSIPSRFREIVDMVASVGEYTYGDYVVSVALYYRRASYMHPRRIPVFADAFPPTLRMPDWLWKRMLRARARRSAERIESLLEEIEEEEAGEEEEGEGNESPGSAAA